MGATSTQNTKLFRSTDSGTTWLAITDLTSVGYPDGDTSEIDATVLSSTAFEYILGLKDNGSLNFGINVNFTDTQHIALQADNGVNTARSYRVEYPERGAVTVTSVEFSGFLMSFTGDNPVNDKQAFTGTVRITGAVTIVNGDTAE
tara:strand:- start:938 stop:1375 length:438 start_codon:yes stop_codon:yes gene_type:complete